MENSLNQIYSVIGAEIESVGLEKLFSKITPFQQEQIFGACSRLHLIDSIQHTKFNFESWMLINADALQMYLMCTCFDSLADRNAKGVGKRFANLFTGLKTQLKNELIQSYYLLHEPQENLQHWEGLSVEEKIERVVQYIYKLRRNTFTHQAKILPAAFAARGISGSVLIIPQEVWKNYKDEDEGTEYSVYFNYRFPQLSELSLLRLIIIGRIRQILELNVDEAFISYYWNNLKKFHNPQHKNLSDSHLDSLHRLS